MNSVHDDLEKILNEMKQAKKFDEKKILELEKKIQLLEHTVIRPEYVLTRLTSSQLKINTHMKLKKGNYIVSNPLVISENGLLEIEPGTKLLFYKSAGIYCKGILLARGNENNNIIFSAYKDSWKNISLNGCVSSQSIISYCDISRTTGKNVLNHSKEGGGGAIELVQSDATLEHNSIHHCTSYNGTGIYIERSSAQITENKIFDNIARNYGAGIYANNSYPVISKNTIINNSAISGGGIHFEKSNGKIFENSISRNRSGSTGSGGGINLESDSSPEIYSNHISENQGKKGAAISISESYPFIFDNKIWYNKSTDSLTGALHIFKSKLELGPNDFKGNTPQNIYGIK